MSNDKNFLITLSNEVFLVRCALKISTGMLDDDAIEFCMEEENKAKFMKLLPLHVQSFGNIVEIEEIFEIEDKTN